MKRLDDRKKMILKDRKAGISLRDLGVKYEASVNTIVQHLKKWRVEDEK